MAREYKSKKDGAEQAAPIQKQYEYKICRGGWNGKTHKHDGCGKLFTMDSVIEYCPECGLRLAHIRYGSPATERVSRIHMEKCEKCEDSKYALPCFCGKPPKSEYCLSCKCRECCREQSAIADSVIKGERTLMDLTRDCIRKRKEEEEARAKKRAEQSAKLVASKKSMKSIGQVLDEMVGLTADGDDIPF
jgi:hypothetical protein